jgi:hypothetical protein
MLVPTLNYPSLWLNWCWCLGIGKLFEKLARQINSSPEQSIFQKAVKVLSGKRTGKPLKYWQKRKYLECRKVESSKREMHFDLMRQLMKQSGDRFRRCTGWRFHDFDWQARKASPRSNQKPWFL